MMKQLSYLIALLAMAAPGSAYASCTATGGFTQLTGTQITNLLVGSLACYPAVGPYQNQEALAGGNITDYKQGPSDTVDPTKIIGTYSVVTSPVDSITYSYSGGPSYTYTVWGTAVAGSGSYDFCVGTTPITVRVASGSAGPC